MIVGKRMVKMKILRFISLLTLVFLMLPLCFSCGKDDALDDIFEKMTFYTNDVSLGETAFTEHIYVVIPKECSGELSLKARELVDKLKEQTGIIVTLKYDNEFNSNPKSSCEILVGGTDRLASKNALDVLKNDEYLCRWDNGAIVICGRSEQATVDALSRFITDILPTASKYSIMSNEAHFERVGEYDISKIILNGYDLYDYKIAYDSKNENFEYELSLILRDSINLKSGYLLDVISSDKVTQSTGKIISLCASSNSSFIETVEGNLMMNGMDSYSLSLTVADLLQMILDNIEAGIAKVDYSKKKSFEYNGSSFGVSFYLFKKAQNGSIDLLSELLNSMEYNDIGLHFVTNYDEEFYTRLVKYVPSGHEIRTVSLGMRKILIAYDTAKVKMIDVSASSDQNAVNVDIQTLFGEKLRYSYIINAQKNALADSLLRKDGTVAFAEGYSDELNIDEKQEIASGEVSIDLNTVKYKLVANDRLYSESDGVKVEQNTERICCSVKASVKFSNEVLNNTLK